MIVFMLILLDSGSLRMKWNILYNTHFELRNYRHGYNFVVSMCNVFVLLICVIAYIRPSVVLLLRIVFNPATGC